MDDIESRMAERIAAECRRARSKFPMFNSAHEGFAVLYEEVDELWEAVRMKKGRERSACMRAEVEQVGAMALRFLIDMEAW
jgi:hypothetical protein